MFSYVRHLSTRVFSFYWNKSAHVWTARLLPVGQRVLMCETRAVSLMMSAGECNRPPIGRHTADVHSDNELSLISGGAGCGLDDAQINGWACGDKKWSKWVDSHVSLVLVQRFRQLEIETQNSWVSAWNNDGSSFMETRCRVIWRCNERKREV